MLQILCSNHLHKDIITALAKIMFPHQNNYVLLVNQKTFAKLYRPGAYNWDFIHVQYCLLKFLLQCSTYQTADYKSSSENYHSCTKLLNVVPPEKSNSLSRKTYSKYCKIPLISPPPPPPPPPPPLISPPGYRPIDLPTEKYSGYKTLRI